MTSTTQSILDSITINADLAEDGEVALEEIVLQNPDKEYPEYDLTFGEKSVNSNHWVFPRCRELATIYARSIDMLSEYKERTGVNLNDNQFNLLVKEMIDTYKKISRLFISEYMNESYHEDIIVEDNKNLKR